MEAVWSPRNLRVMRVYRLLRQNPEEQRSYQSQGWRQPAFIAWLSLTKKAVVAVECDVQRGEVKVCVSGKAASCHKHVLCLQLLSAVSGIFVSDVTTQVLTAWLHSEQHVRYLSNKACRPRNMFVVCLGDVGYTHYNLTPNSFIVDLQSAFSFGSSDFINIFVPFTLCSSDASCLRQRSWRFGSHCGLK
jgi:hypothetical protein